MLYSEISKRKRGTAHLGWVGKRGKMEQKTNIQTTYFISTAYLSGTWGLTSEDFHAL
jgi:hypothetical protein